MINQLVQKVKRYLKKETKPAVAAKMEATENKVEYYKKKWGNDNGYPIVTKQMKEFHKACKDICITEQRTCSVMEIKAKINIDQSTAYRLKERCVSAGLIDFRFGRHGSLKPHGYTIPIDIEV